MPPSFTHKFTASAQHIDELNHVNNAVWVQWIQDLATLHWEAVGRTDDRDQFFWVVVRHEIDYRGNIALGEGAVGTTYIPGPPKGATLVRAADFTNADGKMIVSARTTWALMERSSQRLARVRPELLGSFLEQQ